MLITAGGWLPLASVIVLLPGDALRMGYAAALFWRPLEASRITPIWDNHVRWTGKRRSRAFRRLGRGTGSAHAA